MMPIDDTPTRATTIPAATPLPSTEAELVAAEEAWMRLTDDEFEAWMQDGDNGIAFGGF